MNDATIHGFRELADAMLTSMPDWQWIGQHMSQRMFGITEQRAKDYAAKHGGTASRMLNDKLTRLIQGSREIVNDEFLDSVSTTDYGSEIRTCRNRQRCGVHDAYVAWILDIAKPIDLEFREGYAIGSR